MWKIGRVDSSRLTPEDCSAMREHGIFVKARGIIKMLQRLHPGVTVQPEQVQKMLWDAFKATDAALGEADAMKWAEGFEFPPDIIVVGIEKILSFSLQEGTRQGWWRQAV